MINPTIHNPSPEEQTLLEKFMDQRNTITNEDIKDYLIFLKGDNIAPVSNMEQYVEAAIIRSEQLKAFIKNNFTEEKALINNAFRRKDDTGQSLLMHLCKKSSGKLEQIETTITQLLNKHPNVSDLSDCLLLDKNTQGIHLARQAFEYQYEGMELDRTVIGNMTSNIRYTKETIDSVTINNEEKANLLKKEKTELFKSLDKYLEQASLTQRFADESESIGDQHIKSWLESLSSYNIPSDILLKAVEMTQTKIVTFIQKNYTQHKNIIINAFSTKQYSGSDLLSFLLSENKGIQIVDTIFDLIENNAQDWSKNGCPLFNKSNKAINIIMAPIIAFEDEMCLSKENAGEISTRIKKMEAAGMALNRITNLEASIKTNVDAFITACTSILTTIRESEKTADLLNKLYFPTQHMDTEDIKDFLNFLKHTPLSPHAMTIAALRHKEINEFFTHEYVENKQLIIDTLSLVSESRQNILIRLIRLNNENGYDLAASILSIIKNNPTDWSLPDATFVQKTIYGSTFLDYLEPRINQVTNRSTCSTLIRLITNTKDCINTLLEESKSNNAMQENTEYMALNLTEQCDSLLNMIKEKQKRLPRGPYRPRQKQPQAQSQTPDQTHMKQSASQPVQLLQKQQTINNDDPALVQIINSNQPTEEKLEAMETALGNTNTGLFDCDAEGWTILMHAVFLQDQPVFDLIIDRLQSNVSKEQMQNRSVAFNDIDAFIRAKSKDNKSVESIMDAIPENEKNLEILVKLQGFKIKRLEQSHIALNKSHIALQQSHIALHEVVKEICKRYQIMTASENTANKKAKQNEHSPSYPTQQQHFLYQAPNNSNSQQQSNNNNQDKNKKQ